MSAVVVGDTQLRALLEAADRASTAGRREEEARFLSDAQAAAPGHPMVMNALAMSAFSRGDMQQARSLLESALIVDTRAPTLWLNFALVCRGLNDTSNEMAALDKALALNPYYFLALLQKATTLERLGKAKQAASVFQAFIACVPPQAQQSPSVQAAVVYAREAVQSNNQALDSYLKERLGFLSQSGQERFEECIDVLLGKKRVFTQQPTFMHFPRLPAIPFYDRGDF
ncbi:MAG: hypothetical protein H7Y02_03545, partial [Candidatus Obscuribacterales bacterium]|nr:hypothetical protein [Steroidobacteraceae bacterium]